MDHKTFVREYLSPAVAAALNNKYRSWKCEYKTGDEILAAGAPKFERILEWYEYVVATVTDDTGDTYCYYINVSMDSNSAILYDVVRAIYGK